MSVVHTTRLLIADDDPDQLAALASFFGYHGFDIRTASNSADAFIIYCGWLPHVAIFDIEMPGGDGRRLSRAIRDFAGEPPPFLIALSGLSSLSEPSRSLNAGFDRHFTKPAQLPVLLAEIAFLKGGHG
nr:response regulator [Paraburkholderia sp. BL8N3]